MTDSVTTDARRFWIPLPRPLSIFLAAVFLVVIAAGLRFGLPIYRQHVAIREIRRLGGEVRVKTNGPEWICDQLPNGWNEAFGRVFVVDLGISTVTDADLRWFKDLPDVVVISVDRSRVTNAGLESLAILPGLRHVMAIGTGVTSQGIEQLHVTAPHIAVTKYRGRKLVLDPETPD